MSGVPQSPFATLLTSVKIHDAEMLRHGFDGNTEVALTCTLIGWRPKTIPFWKVFKAVRLDAITVRVVADGWLRRRYRFDCVAKDDHKCLFSFVPAHPSRWLRSLLWLGTDVDDPCRLHARPIHGLFVNAGTMIWLSRLAVTAGIVWLLQGYLFGLFPLLWGLLMAAFTWTND
jgi:hypothetical protein